MAEDHDDDRVVIRLRDVYHIAKRTEEKVDLVAYAVGEKLPDHENRLRSMEKRVWAIPSLSAIIAVISLLIALRPHGAPTVSNNSAPSVSQPTVVSAPPTATTAPITVQVSVPRKHVPPSTTTTTNSPTTTAPPARTSPSVTVPQPPATLVERIESLTNTVTGTVSSLTKGI